MINSQVKLKIPESWHLFKVNNKNIRIVPTEQIYLTIFIAQKVEGLVGFKDQGIYINLQTWNSKFEDKKFLNLSSCQITIISWKKKQQQTI